MKSHTLATVCLTLENIMLIERSRSQKATDMIAFTWNVQNRPVFRVSGVGLARRWGGLGEMGSDGVSFWGDGNTPEMIVALVARGSEGAEPLNCRFQRSELCGL